MHLTRLYVENYKSIEKIDLKFKKGRNVIVGRNNTGKSNLIKAIDLVLGQNSPTWKKSDNITDNEFYKGNTNNQIFIWCEIHKDDGEKINFKDIENGAISKIQDGRTDYRLKIDQPVDAKGQVFNYCGDDGEARFESEGKKKLWIGGKVYCKATFDAEFSNKSHFTFVFRCQKVGKIFEKDLIFLYREDESKNWLISLQPNLREVILNSAIIPAFRDPKNQLSVSGWGWYSKLLRQYVKTDDPGLIKAFEHVKGASEIIFKDLKRKVCDHKINIAFPGTKVSFQFNPDSKQDIHKSTLIYVDDGFNSQLQDKGSGIQSAVIIGLFDFYTREIAHSAGSSLLAIEEPELYLHPHGRRVISDRIHSFIDHGKNQVILTTHSAEFISSIEEQNIIVAKKIGTATTAKEIYFDSAKRKQLLIKKQNAEMFFADAVILVEGADKYFIELIGMELGKRIYTGTSKEDRKLVGKNWMNEHNVSVINCGGKTELWKYADVLTELNTPYFVLADFDFFCGGLSEYFTNLKKASEKRDKLNAVKSHCGISEKNSFKSLQQVDASKHEKIRDYLKMLSEKEKIYILEGDLESLYKIKPSATKEQGVIETISSMIEQKNEISKYLNVDLFETVLKDFMKHVLCLAILEEK